MENQNQTPAGTPAETAPQGTGSVRGTTTGESVATGPAATPPGAPSAPPAKAGAPSTPAAAASPASPPTGAPRGKVVTMSEADLRDRLARAEQARLKKLFGTDDPKEIQARIDAMKKMEARQEAERQARLSNEQKLQEQLAAEKARAKKAEQRARTLHEQRVVQEQGSLVMRHANQHVNPDYTDEATLAFARHIQQQDPRVVARMTEKDVGKWFANYVQKKPALARNTPAAAPPTPRVERTPAGAPRPPPRPQGTGAPANPEAKTLRPGQPNSMTRFEAQQELKRRGISYG